VHWHVLVNVALRGLIGELATDLIENSRRLVAGAGVSSVEEVRACPDALAAFSPAVRERDLELKGFLWEKLYRHPRIDATMKRAGEVLRSLFETYRDRPELMPVKFQRRGLAEGMERSVCDYVAGMTDRYAIEEYRRLVDPKLDPDDPLSSARAR
jgi:dGTPase